MEFTTKVDIPHSPMTISHHDRVMMMGSCFAENVGEKLIRAKFQINLNPFGILYNPLSISQSLNRLIENRPFAEDELVEDNGLYHSFWHHSRFSSDDKEDALRKINEAFAEAHNCLKQTNILLVTFGTAYVYRLCANKMVVGNCHKFPAADFERFRLSVSDIVSEWNPLLGKLKAINPNIKILFTVSPIRHFKDGAHDNQLSKATLLLAAEELKKQHETIAYFPSYEIMMDELRDYRFYAEDMVHPSDVAVQYIYERFAETYFSSDTMKVIKEWDKIAAAIAHRPFDEKGADYKHFLSLTLNKVALFKEKYPYICCSEEEKLLTNRLQGD